MRRDAVCLCGYAVLTAVAGYPLFAHFNSALPGGGDSWLYYWNLWWVRRAVVDLHVTPYFTSDVYYPYGASLFFHTLNLLPSVIGLPFAVWIGLPAAYNFLVLLSFTLSGYAMYRLVLEILGDESAWPAAFIAGAAFAFSSYRYIHLLGHLDLISTQWLPLFVLFLLKTMRERRRRDSMACAALLVAAALTSLYYLMFLLLFTALALSHLAWTRGRDGWPATKRVIGALAMFALALSPLLVQLLILGRAQGRSPNPAADMDRFSTDLLAFIVPSPLATLWTGLVRPMYDRGLVHGDHNESVAFLGFVPLCLAAIGIKRCPTTRTLWLIGAALFGALALGPTLYLAGRSIAPSLSMLMPYSLLSRLPYGDIPRVPGRFVVMVSLCVSVVAGCGAWTFLSHRPTSHAVGITAALVALILMENAVVPWPTSVIQAPPYFERLARDDVRGGVIEVPIPDDPAVFPRRMQWQTVHGQPVYGGYLARGLPPLPFAAIPGFGQFRTSSGEIDDVVSYDAATVSSISRSVLAVYGARHLVIEKALMPPADHDRARRTAEMILEIPPDYEDAFTIAYRISGAERASSAAVWLDTGWSFLERLAERDISGRTLRWRWMGARARLGLIAPAPVTARLELTAQSYRRPRRIRCSIGGAEVAMLEIAPRPDTYRTPTFTLPAGHVFVDLESLDGTESPGADPRRLSIALFDLKLTSTD